MVAGIAVALAGLSAFLILTLLKPLSQAAQWAPQFVAGLEPATSSPQSTDEVSQLTESLRNLDAEFRNSLLRASTTLEDLLAHPDTNHEIAPPSGVRPEESARWVSVVQSLAQWIRNSRQQNAQMSRILATIPIPVTVSDANGRIVFLNPAAETALALAPGTWANKAINSFFSDPPNSKPTVFLTEWLRGGHGAKRDVIVRSADGKSFVAELRMTDASAARKDGQVTLVVLDQTERIRAELARLAQGRKATARQLVARFARETGNAHDIFTQTKLLIQDAKQTSFRDKLLPRLRAVSDHARQVETLQLVLSWCSTVLWGKPPEQSPTEFMAVEAAQAVQESLTARFQARNNTLSVVDDKGGWVLCDESWLRAALAGVLMHASDSTTDTTIDLTVSRASGDKSGAETVIFTVSDAGPVLTPAQASQLDNPFAGIEGLDLDTFGNTGGFPLGLLLSKKMTEQLGGKMTFTPTANNRMSARIEIPSRLAGSMIMAAPDEMSEKTTEEETCAGWRMGFAPESPRKGALR